MPRSVAWAALAIALIAGSLTACLKPKPPQAETSIAFFDASPPTVHRSQAVTLSWKAAHVGAQPGTASCRLARQAEGETPEAVFAVACEGSFTEVPIAPSTASYVRYRLDALRRPYTPADPYLSRELTVTLLDDPQVMGVVLDPPSLDLAIGDEALVVATVDARGGASTAVSWSSSNPDVAVVDGAGTVSALDAGSAVITATSVFDPTKSDGITATITATGTLRWEVVIGGSGDERAGGVAVDGEGNVFVAVTTTASLAGPSSGESDVVLAKFDAQGNMLWSRQFGSSAADRALGVAVDRDGNAIVTGRTDGNLAAPNAGNADAFLAKFGPTGETVWRLQFGTEAVDYGTAIATDALGNVLVGGVTAGSLTGDPKDDTNEHAFLAKFNADGTRLWTRQFFETRFTDYVCGVAVGPAGNVAVAVTGYRNHGYVRHFDAAGNATWYVGLGTYFAAYDVAFDAVGNAYVTGTVTDNPFALPSTAYLHKFGPTADRSWERSLGPAEGSYGYGVAIDGRGNAFVAGFTLGDIGAANPGAPGFLVKYDGTGDRVWVQQFAPVPDYLAVDEIGNAYALGTGAGAVHLLKFAP